MVSKLYTASALKNKVSFGLWEREARSPPKIEKLAKMIDTIMDYSDSQAPLSDEYLYHDVEYSELQIT
jgi:hypothetical protein